jgi:hypothetical protein
MTDLGVKALADAGGPSIGTSGKAVSLDASASVVPGGTITNYEWDFDGDGTYDQATTTPTTHPRVVRTQPRAPAAPLG